MTIPEENPLYGLIPEEGEAPAEGSGIVIITTEQWEDYRKERRTDRHWQLAQGVLLALAMLAIAFLVKDALAAEQNRRKVGVANQRILESIERQTSPEAVAAREDSVNAIILTVDCNNRRATEEALNQISAQRPDLWSRIRLTDNCPPDEGD